MKKNLVIIVLFLISTQVAVSHNEWVHQHIVLQAWNLLQQKYPSNSYPLLYYEMGNHIGSITTSMYDFQTECTQDFIIGTIAYGALREDVTDPVLQSYNGQYLVSHLESLF